MALSMDPRGREQQYAQIDSSTTRHMWSVSFYLRTPVVGDSGERGYRFDPLHNSDNTTRVYPPGFRLLQPPSIGDRILLHYREPGTDRRLCGEFRVVDRRFSYVTYGSAAWPAEEPIPRHAGLVEIHVEHVDGMYAAEVGLTVQDLVDQHPGPGNRLLVHQENGGVEFQIRGEEGDWVTVVVGHLDPQDSSVIVFDRAAAQAAGEGSR